VITGGTEDGTPVSCASPNRGDTEIGARSVGRHRPGSVQAGSGSVAGTGAAAGQSPDRTVSVRMVALAPDPGRVAVVSDDSTMPRPTHQTRRTPRTSSSAPVGSE
jgi:hypothetical protein